MNNFQITGRLTKDPDVRYTAEGKIVTKFRLAENFYNKKAGQQDAQFHNFVAFGKTAEIIGNTLSKGRKIHVSGIIKNNSYMKDDERRYFTEIVVREFEYCDSKPGAPGAVQPQPAA